MEQGFKKVRRGGNLAIWTKRVEACRSSGLSIKQWCAENGIVPNTYYYWQKKVYNARCTNQIEFYEVPELQTTAIAANVEINGFSANIYCGADEETLRALLSGMKLC